MANLVTLTTLRQYQSKSAIREVLGCLIKQPGLLASNKITVDDFVEAFHKVVFVAINNCFENGMEKLDSIIIEDYLQNAFPSKYGIFKRNNGAFYIEKASEMAILENFPANYKEMRKFTVLRELVKEGTDVSEFFDPNEVDSELVDAKREYFEECTSDDILNYYRSKLLKISEQFNSNSTRESMKAGGNELRRQKEEWKKSVAYGLSYASDFLTTITYGMRGGKFTLCSASSGTGKTRVSCANVCKSFVCEYYKDGHWYKNPHGTQNGVVYIGTEMELLKEIQPILLAYIADVPEEHITEGKYEPGEEERVDYAIDVLDRSRIYLEYVPDYDIGLLEKIIDYHIVEHKIGHVIFDYIHTTAELLREYQDQIKVKMNVREDQALSNVGLKLKDISRKYNVSVDSWTQVSGDFKNEQNYDQTIIRGAKSLADKIDVGAIVSRPTPKEYKLLEKILRSPAHLGQPKPNICYSVYKNRGSKYNKVKIWLYIDYDTMRVHDQFCTDYEYNIISIPQTYIEIDEDQKVVISNDKKTLTRNLNEATYIMNQIEDDDESVVDDFEEEIEEEFTPNSVEDVESTLENLNPEDIVNLNLSSSNLAPDIELRSEDGYDDENDSEVKNINKQSKKNKKDEEFPPEKEIKFVPKLSKNSKYSAEDFDW